VVEHEQLTEKQAEALRNELAQLEGPRREEVVASIKTAREFGDLSENFEYHAAKNEQGLLEARIRTLRSRLETAEIVPEAGSDVVGVGSVVEVEGNGRTMTVEVSAVGGAGTVSPAMPKPMPNVTGMPRMRSVPEICFSSARRQPASDM